MRVFLFDKDSNIIGSDTGYKVEYIPNVGETLVLGAVTYTVIDRSFHISTQHNEHEVHLNLVIA